MLHPIKQNTCLTKEEISQYRLHLYEKQEGLCYWCLHPMQFFDKIPNQHSGNIATFEHLHDRLSYSGRKHTHGTVVISCSKCNNDRNRIREKIVVKELKQHLQGSYPIKIRGVKPYKLLRQLGINPLQDIE